MPFQTVQLLQVAIFDYDVHHGNGTHDIFYDDPDILFISTHQQGSYPGTGKLTEIGGKAAQGATINIPLPGRLLDTPCLFTQTALPRAAQAVHKTRVAWTFCRNLLQWLQSRSAASHHVDYCALA